jgi:hypothetical protein
MAFSTHGKEEECIQALVRTPEGRIPLGRPERRWEDNIKMDLKETDGVVWAGLIWLRIGNKGELLGTR